MRTAGVAALLVALSSCAPAPPPPTRVPVVQRVPLARPDWFQRELASANTARRSHQPAGDKDGAQAAYDRVLRAACQRVAIEGPDKYKPRCDAVLKVNPAPTPDPFACDANADEETLQACND